MGIITRKEASEGAQAISLGFIVTVVVIFLVGVLSATLWAFGVIGSGIKGDGDVHKMNQDAKNRVHWNAVFNAEYEQIKADQGKIALLKSAAEGDTGTQLDKINYQGAQQVCQDDVAEYNANTGKMLAADWLPAGLPSEINAADYCG